MRPGALRRPRTSLVLALLLAGCQSNPTTDVSISPHSSLLAVDVLFPSRFGRDVSLVQAFFVKGPIHGRMEELPQLVPATFVKWSRAYLLNPEPGTYSLVAATAAFAPPWNREPIAGVTKTRASVSSAEAIVLPAELIRRTRTTIAPGRVAFMGALRIARGDRIDADTGFQGGALERRLAERLRPGVTSASGISGWLMRARLVDLDQTSVGDAESDRRAFLDAALRDLGASPWSQVIARESPTEEMPATPGPEQAVPIPEAVAATSPPAVAPPEATGSQATAAPSPAGTSQPAVAPTPERVAALPRAATPRAEPPPPKRRRFPGIPPESPLSEIESGMSHDEVRRILGPPDDRIDRITAKAWIPFYTGPGTHLRDWVYEGEGRVVFSLHDGSLEVVDVTYGPNEQK